MDNVGARVLNYVMEPFVFGVLCASSAKVHSVVVDPLAWADREVRVNALDEIPPEVLHRVMPAWRLAKVLYVRGRDAKRLCGRRLVPCPLALTWNIGEVDVEKWSWWPDADLDRSGRLFVAEDPIPIMTRVGCHVHFTGAVPVFDVGFITPVGRVCANKADEDEDVGYIRMRCAPEYVDVPHRLDTAWVVDRRSSRQPVVRLPSRWSRGRGEVQKNTLTVAMEWSSESVTVRINNATMKFTLDRGQRMYAWKHPALYFRKAGGRRDLQVEPLPYVRPGARQQGFFACNEATPNVVHA